MADNLIGFARANQDLVAELVFSATLQLRTPLRVLLRDGEVHRDLATSPPAYAQEPWEGVWVPRTKTWKELTGVDMPEFKPDFRASDIGPQPERGMRYRDFLVAMRRVFEADWQSEAEMEAAVIAEASRPHWAEFLTKHGGTAAVLKGLRKKTKKRSETRDRR